MSRLLANDRYARPQPLKPFNCIVRWPRYFPGLYPPDRLPGNPAFPCNSGRRHAGDPDLADEGGNAFRQWRVSPHRATRPNAMAPRQTRSIRRASSAVGLRPSMMRARAERLTPARRAISVRAYPKAINPAKCSAVADGCGGKVWRKAFPIVSPEMGAGRWSRGSVRRVRRRAEKGKKNRAGGMIAPHGGLPNVGPRFPNVRGTERETLAWRAKVPRPQALETMSKWYTRWAYQFLTLKAHHFASE